jgi:hypothetical protein
VVEPSSAVTEAGRKEVDWSSGEAEPREGGGIGPKHARPVVLPGRTGRTRGGDVALTSFLGVEMKWQDKDSEVIGILIFF